MPKEIKVGLIDGKFHPCPEKWKCCVSTHASKDDEKHYIEPIKFTGSLEEAKMKIKKIINSFKRTELLEEKENYLHFKFTTAFWRFKDDVEFLFQDMDKTIHFRSKSRLKGNDWNTNRRRMEEVRRLFLS
jgi:uncharacterized protein (DUF1499 family)